MFPISFYSNPYFCDVLLRKLFDERTKTEDAILAGDDSELHFTRLDDIEFYIAQTIERRDEPLPDMPDMPGLKNVRIILKDVNDV